MAKFEINQKYNSQNHKQTVEADGYVQEGDFFVFYDEQERKVLTVASKLIFSIDQVAA